MIFLLFFEVLELVVVGLSLGLEEFWCWEIGGLENIFFWWDIIIDGAVMRGGYMLKKKRKERADRRPWKCEKYNKG